MAGLPIGPLELIIILVIALLVLGPGKLPEVGSAFGKTIREFRRASSDFQDATDLERPANARERTPAHDAASTTERGTVVTAPATAPASAASDASLGRDEAAR